MANIFFDGGGGPPDTGGGGSPGTGTGTNTQAGGQLPNNENGGVFASEWFLLSPVKSLSGTCYLAIFDVDDFNDQNNGSYYFYRMEDVAPNSQATVNRVILQYRDLGIAKITVRLVGTNDNKEIVSTSVQVTVGTVGATRAIFTQVVDMSLTCFRPQLQILRAIAGGPFSLIAATIIGEVEEDFTG